MNELFVSMVFSTLGAAYFIYGKKEADMLFMLAGGMLAIYPYFVPTLGAMFVIGVLLAASPFVARRMGY